jgi:hypothetical protein
VISKNRDLSAVSDNLDPLDNLEAEVFLDAHDEEDVSDFILSDIVSIFFLRNPDFLVAGSVIFGLLEMLFRWNLVVGIMPTL